MAKPAKMLGEVLDSLFQKPSTVLYPFERLPLPERFRGRIAFDASLCIGCKICERDCPSGAIAIVKREGGSFRLSYTSKSARARRTVEIPNASKKHHKCRLRINRCIFCAQCVESCPKKALSSTADYELAVLGSNTPPPERKTHG